MWSHIKMGPSVWGPNVWHSLSSVSNTGAIVGSCNDDDVIKISNVVHLLLPFSMDPSLRLSHGGVNPVDVLAGDDNSRFHIHL
jgi:hypothetical protein